MDDGEHVTIIGDLHGDLDDLLMILEKVGFPSSDHRMIFNGDFVDRGQHGVEVRPLNMPFVLESCDLGKPARIECMPATLNPLPDHFKVQVFLPNDIREHS
eukprot:1350601-Amorphochlora_amoeboformis.AAC.1